VPRSLELAGKVTRLMTGVVSTLRVHPERMWEVLCAGFSQATDLAEYVMQSCGIDYRSAYLLVGAAVRKASREGLRGIDLTGAMLDQAAAETIGRRLGLAGRDLSEVLDPRAIVLTRTSLGGAAPEVVRRMAADQAAAASATRDRAAKALGALHAAESALVSAAEEVARRRG
jgi:argininosuccinate lyase